jgi:tetratricopeptide (TPR) repeat protein
MGRAGTRIGRIDVLDAGAGAALVLLAAVALLFAVELGTAAGVGGGDLVAELRARSEKRLTQERAQIRGLLELASQGRAEEALRGGELALASAGDNSQLHLLLAAGYRARGEDAAALRAYRRAVELGRDYVDRRSPHYLGTGFRDWVHAAKPRLQRAAAAAVPGAEAALRDLYFLERSLAGGCT